MQYNPLWYVQFRVGKTGIVGALGAIETRTWRYGSFSSTVGTLVQPVETIKTASRVTTFRRFDRFRWLFLSDDGDLLLYFIDLLQFLFSFLSRFPLLLDILFQILGLVCLEAGDSQQPQDDEDEHLHDFIHRLFSP